MNKGKKKQQNVSTMEKDEQWHEKTMERMNNKERMMVHAMIRMNNWKGTL